MGLVLSGLYASSFAHFAPWAGIKLYTKIVNLEVDRAEEFFSYLYSQLA